MSRIKRRQGPAQPLSLGWTIDAGDWVTGLTYSARTGRCAVATGAGELLIGDDGKVIARTVAHDDGVLCLAWSEEAGRLASAGNDGHARLWDAELRPLAGHRLDGSVEHVAWAKGGQRWAASHGKFVSLFDASGARVSTLGPSASAVAGITFDPSGQRLAVAAYGGVVLHDVAGQSEPRRLDWKGSLISVTWSPDGRVIACGCQDKAVHFWRLPSGKDAQMSGYGAKPRALAWSWDASLLATSGGTDVDVWGFSGKGPEGTSPISLVGHTQLVHCSAFAPRSQALVTGDASGRVIRWMPTMGPAPTALGGIGVDAVTALLWTGEGNQVLAGDAGGRVASLT